MSRVEEIERAIQQLSPEEFAQVAQCIQTLEQERWDGELDRDASAGKLDFLIAEAGTAEGLARSGMKSQATPRPGACSRNSPRMFDAWPLRITNYGARTRTPHLFATVVSRVEKIWYRFGSAITTVLSVFWNPVPSRGSGLALLPNRISGSAIGNDQCLRRVTTCGIEFRAEAIHRAAVSHADLARTARIRAVTDPFVERFASEAPRLGGDDKMNEAHPPAKPTSSAGRRGFASQ